MNNTFGSLLQPVVDTRAYTPHALSASSYGWYSYLAMATATGSTTDSTAQDNIPQKGTSASELKTSHAQIWAKKSFVPSSASGNGYTALLRTD